METLSRSQSTNSRRSTSSSVGRRVSRSRSKATAKGSTTNAVSLLCDSVKSWLSATRDGCCGKTYRGRFLTNEEKLLPACCTGLGNSGISAHGEFWTLDISESHSDAVECSLSDVVDPGDTLGRCYLSREQMGKMLARLEKYKQENELTRALRVMLSGGLATQPPSSEST